MSLELDRNRIVIRERSHAEILDLGLRVFRANAGPLALLLALGALPMALLNAWLLAGLLEMELEPDSVTGYFFLMVCLAFLEAPLATAPATLYLGQAVFSQRPQLRSVAADFARSLVQLVLFQVLLRPLLFAWLYLNEVILLERNPIFARRGGKTTLSRARGLHRAEGADLLARRLMWYTVGGLLTISLWLSIYMLRVVLLNQRDFDRSMSTVWFPVALWTVIGYFAVVRFLSYLDLRIRREGWEVELRMRAEGARLARPHA